MGPLVIEGKDNIEQFLIEYGIVNKDDPSMNAQILAHSTGKSGAEFKRVAESIASEGLYISNRSSKISDSNSYVASGLLSTSVLINDADNNVKNLGGPFISTGASFHIGENEIASIVCAIPQEIGGIVLGRIHPDRDLRSDGKTCILDMLDIEQLPPEFVLGISIGDDRDPSKSKFVINPNFYALSKENEDEAVLAIKRIIGKDPIGPIINPSEYSSSEIESAKFLTSRLAQMMKQYENLISDVEHVKGSKNTR